MNEMSESYEEFVACGSDFYSNKSVITKLS